MTRLLFFALLVAVSRPAHADRPALAVLDVDADEAAVDPAIPRTLTDEMRGVATRKLGGAARVMTREVMATLATPEQLRCTAGQCIATIARILQARFVLGGTLEQRGAQWGLRVEAYDSSDGNMLGNLTLRAADPEQLVDDVSTRLSSELPRWFDGLLDAGTEESVRVELASEPSGAVVFVDGQLRCQTTPCNVVVGSGSHEVRMELALYESQTRTVSFGVRESSAKFALKESFAWVTIETTPSGLPVSIDGGSPLTRLSSLRLSAGGHEVLLRDDCFERSGARFSVKAGEKRVVKLTAQPVHGGVRFRAEDGAGNAVAARVTLDGGAEVGTTPCTVRVPVCAKRAEFKSEAGAVSMPLAVRSRTTTEVTAKVSR